MNAVKIKKQNHLKEFFSKYNLDIIISLVLFIAAIIFFLLSIYFSNRYEKLDEFFINLSAGLIGSVTTIWGIEYLRKKQIEKRTVNARKVAKQDIIFLRNMLTAYICNAFGIYVYQYIKDGDFIEESSQKAIRQILVDVSKKDLLRLTRSLTISQWKHLQINLPFIRIDLSEKIQLYRDIFPEEILGQLLIINKNFNSLYSVFGLFSDLFTKEEKDWPTNIKGVEENKKIRETWLITLSKNLKVYFEEVLKFSELLEKTNF